MDLLARNLAAHREMSLLRYGRPIINWVTQYNSRRRSRKNVAHHYDLSNELYRLFLAAARGASPHWIEPADLARALGELKRGRIAMRTTPQSTKVP